jgi:hypothetical protein
VPALGPCGPSPARRARSVGAWVQRRPLSASTAAFSGPYRFGAHASVTGRIPTARAAVARRCRRGSAIGAPGRVAPAAALLDLGSVEELLGAVSDDSSHDWVLR